MAAQDFPSSSSSSSSSAASSKTEPSSYDVFLSFRGEDTRKSFTGFLYRMLKNKGINAFIDSEKLRTGEAIDPALWKAIEGSKISIPVISQRYADSKWCLRELVRIVQCHRSNNQIIIPIFFYVNPSDVRKQTGSFGDAFQKYQEEMFEPKEVESWREALRVVGNLKGEVVDDTKDQAELVEFVAKWVLSESVRSTRLAECEYRIDMDSRVDDLISLLDIGSNDVKFVGICGSGGLGKTTLAKAVYNGILSTFDNHCFLSDVRERAAQFNGLVSLQKQFLEDIFKEEFRIDNSDKGKTLIQERVSDKKVFLVLDDADGKEQIEALAGNLSWFGQGSRVVITTRDEQILNLAKVNGGKIYRPELLSHASSLELFSWHAFQKNQPPDDYMQLSHDVVDHSEGLPLILEVFGSHLSNASNKDEWESTLARLKEIPPGEVQRKLRISYDKLDHYEKDIFLDAACFFIKWGKEYVISIWEALGYHPKSLVPRLTQRSLLKFDGKYLVMHDHIRDMGREIVLEESRSDPSKRSRLWSYDDIVEVLGHKGIQTTQGISLPYDSRPPINLTVESLEMMPNLRFIHGENFKILSPILYHRKLASLTLSRMDCDQLLNVRPPDEHKRFQNLKFLKLLTCHSLSKSPEFSWFPSLEQLYFDECSSLDELDKSIGQLSQLKCLIVSKCSFLNKLPESIGDLKSLVKLDLSSTGIEELPDSISQISSLKELILEFCRIKKLPDSIGDLTSLLKLDLCSTRIEELPESISRMSSLKELILMLTSSLKKLPQSIGDLKSLVELDLLHSGIEELPDNICKMSHLKKLLLGGCKSLKKLPESIDNIPNCQLALNLSNTGIEEVPDSICKMSSLKELILSWCSSLKKLPESIGDLKSLVELDLSYSGIQELPDSISSLNSLKKLILRECVSLVKFPNFLGRLHGLEVLDFGGCSNVSLVDITKFPDDFSVPQNLVELKISYLELQSFPLDIAPLKTLKQLKISRWGKLEYLPELPSNLVELCCEDCDSLGRLPDLSKLKSLTTLDLSYCRKLEEIPGLEGIESLEKLNVRGCLNLRHAPRKTQATLLPSNRALAVGSAHTLTANDEICKNGFMLSFGLVFSRDDMKLGEGHQLAIDVYFAAIVCQKEKRIRCHHMLRIEDVKELYNQETICRYHFKGLNWFGIPLQGEDSIQILKNRAVAWLNYGPYEHPSLIRLSCIRLDPVSEAVGQEEDTLNLTSWPRAEVEGSTTVPDKQKEEEEEEEEDRNNVPAADFLSHLDWALFLM